MLIIIDKVKAHKCKHKQRVGYMASQENHNHASQEAFLLEGNGLTNKRLKRERIFVRGGIRFLRITAQILSHTDLQISPFPSLLSISQNFAYICFN